MLEFQVYVKYHGNAEFTKILEPKSRGSLGEVLDYIEGIRDLVDRIGNGPSVIEVRAVV